ncbi:MAG: YfhO family protein [Oscillospiraceae bacterium]|nr:YfhO family protein [Oscillospiraceae bacterium]
MTEQFSAGQKAARRLGGWLSAHGYVILAFLATGLLTLFVWFCFGMIPFGGKTIFRMDLYHQYGPLFAELYERIAGGKSLLYSWDSGLGGNFLGNYYNYLSGPIGFIVLLFGHSRVPEAVGVMILLKGALAAGTFAYMLKKMYGKNNAAITAFGILYAFCGYFIAYYWNVMWIDAMWLLPLVALGIDYIIHKRRFALYAVSLALTLVCSYYMGFMVCIFSAFFYLVRYFSSYELYDTVVPLNGEAKLFDRVKNSRFLQSGALFAFGSLLAAMLSAFALLPVYYALKSSSATSGSFPQDYQSYFSIFDFLANHFADINPTIRSSGEDVLPNIYSGVAAMLLAPLYLFAPSIKVRDKLLHLALLALLFFSFNTNYLNYIWHAFHFPNDLPYRFSFLYSFLLLLVGYRAFLHIKEISAKAILAIGGALVFFAVVVEKIGSKNVQELTIYLTIIFAAIYTLLLFSLHKAGKVKASALSMLLLCCVVTEVCAADTKNFEITHIKENYTIDLADFQKVHNDIKKHDQNFYRVELTDLRTRMDPSWYDYHGISTFSSMAYERTSNLQYHLGLGGNYINSYTYNPQTPVYNAMHNLKYLIENQNHDRGAGSSFLHVLNPALYEQQEAHDRFTVFQNKYHLPIGYWVPDSVAEWDTMNERNPFLIQMDYWERASGVPDVFLPLEPTVNNGLFDSGVNATLEYQYLSYYGKDSSLGDDQRVKLELDTEEAMNCYIYVDTNLGDYHKITVKRNTADGEISEERSHDDRALWDLGVVEPDNPITLELTLHKDAASSGGFSVYTYGLNMAAFAEGYYKLLSGGWNLSSYSETTFAGDIAAPADGLLYTSIPYDEGWQVTVDGKRVPVSDYVAVGDGGLLGIPLPAGGHKVVFHFVPRGLRWGLMISSAGLILLALCGLLSTLLKKRGDQKKEIKTMDDGLLGASEPQPPLGSVVPLFDTANLSPASFSLDLPPEEEEHSVPIPPVIAAPAEDAAPREEGFRIVLDDEAAPEEAGAGEIDPQATPSADSELSDELSALPSRINAMLQEIQEKAEALQKKIHPPEEQADGEITFKMIS